MFGGMLEEAIGGFFGNQPFVQTYRCYSATMMANGRTDVNDGGKIIMPPSALDHLSRLNVRYPMQFKISNHNRNRETHAGVLEFVAEEGRIYLPHWMLSNLYLSEGELVKVTNVSLPGASFAKFQPQSPDFLDIANPKAVLESRLRNFSCLTKGDTFAINYNDRTYEIAVLEVRPAGAVSIIEVDMDVEFAQPVGWVDPAKAVPSPVPKEEKDPEIVIPESMIKQAFPGGGNRLDGKIRRSSKAPVQVPTVNDFKRGIPDYDYVPGKITFLRNAHIVSAEDDSKSFEAFTGEGTQLRTKRDP